MLADIVVDTNVLVHASTPDEPRQAASVQLIKAILDSGTTRLCVDSGFTINESSNKSLVGVEYIKHLRAGTVGYQFVLRMLMGARVTMLPKNAKDRGAAKKVTQMIRKPRDRVFLGIAYNSEEKILVSHDYEDFQASKRVDIRRELSVAVIEADKGAERLLDRAAED